MNPVSKFLHDYPHSSFVLMLGATWGYLCAFAFALVAVVVGLGLVKSPSKFAQEVVARALELMKGNAGGGEGTALRVSQIRQHTVCPYKTDTSVYPSQRLTSGFRKPRCSRERRRMTKTNRALWTTAEKRARSRTTTTNRWTTDGKQQARRSRTNRRAAKATLRTWAGKPPRGCGTEARRERRGEKVCEVIFTKCVFFQTVLKF